METIYVALQDEGVDVWRPVMAARISEGVYDLQPDQKDPDEVWEFAPGSRVNVQWKDFPEGKFLVAISLSE